MTAWSDAERTRIASEADADADAEEAWEQLWYMSNPTPGYLRRKEFFMEGWNRSRRSKEFIADRLETHDPRLR